MKNEVPFSLAEIIEILDKASVGILIVNEEGNIVWGNRHYEKITLMNMDDWIGKDARSLSNAGYVSIMGEETLWSVVQRERNTVHRIVDYKTKDDVIVTATPIFDNCRS